MKEFKEYSKECYTLTDVKKATKELKKSMCNYFGYERSQLRLPNGLVKLQGYSTDINKWINLTDTIGDFGNFVKSNTWSKYRLYLHVQVK